MEIAKILVTSDVAAEIVFNKDFLAADPITQLDLIKDMIGDLTALADEMDIETGILEAIDETGDQHFVLQKNLYTEESL